MVGNAPRGSRTSENSDNARACYLIAVTIRHSHLHPKHSTLHTNVPYSNRSHVFSEYEMTAEQAASGFGRVADDGTVYVRSGAGERQVGQWPGGDPEAALRFYENRYAGLVAEVDLLEKRIAAGAVSPSEGSRIVERLRSTVANASAVGDLDALATRLDALLPLLQKAREARRAERDAKAAEVREARAALVESAETISAGKNWNAGLDQLRELVEQWKELPRSDKTADAELWQRLSAARTAYTKQRRQHFAELDEKRKAVAAAKEKLIAEAEALATSTDWTATTRAFRDLMSRWKSAGSARRDVEKGLWDRFRAAQDAFFTARDAQNTKLDAEYAANADVKRDLLRQAEELVPVRNVRAARDSFRSIAARWDAAGKVPRRDLTDLETRFRRVENQIRRAEEERWRRSNPEAAARAAATVAQLESSIAAARDRLAAASQAGNERAAADAQADLDARESWLAQARVTLVEFGG